jgi:alkylated DNA repair dioxygenase AlkB
MGYHSDDISIMETGTGIFIMSLGDSRTLRFKNIISGKTHDVLLEDNTVIHMFIQTQIDYMHSIIKKESDLPRLSITFRKLK